MNLNNSANSAFAAFLLQSLLKSPDAAGLQQAPSTAPNKADLLKSLAPEAKAALLDDLKKVDLLTSLGRLNQLQGTNLKEKIFQSAFGDAKKEPQKTQTSTEKKIQDALLDFEKDNPDFFGSASRMLVKSYLQEGVSGISTDELSKIVDIVEKLEHEAILRFQQSKAQEKTALDENQQAKSKLESTAISAPRSSGDVSRVFSRKEIAAMPTAEFIKNEAAIQDQIKKGLIAP